MQATTTPQAQPATAPVQVAPVAPVIQVELPDGSRQVYRMPQTRAELSALRQQRQELSDQLQSVAGRRRSLANQLADMPGGAAREGIEARIRQLDARILRLEADIDATGRLITQAPATALVSPSVPGPFGGAMSEESVVILGGVFTVFVLGPLAIAAAIRWLRRSRPVAAAPGAAESAVRLERIEQAVEAIAIEVERISEGQRFTTRLLAEGQSVPAHVGEVPMRDVEPARMRESR